MNEEKDPLIERMREEANRLRPAFSASLHDRLTSQHHREREARAQQMLTKSRWSMHPAFQRLAVAAAVLLVVSGYFAASMFLRRASHVAPSLAKLSPIRPTTVISSAVITKGALAEPTALQPKPAQKPAAPIALQLPVPLQPAPRPSVAIRPPMPLPPAVQFVIPRRIAIQTPTQIVAFVSPAIGQPHISKQPANVPLAEAPIAIEPTNPPPGVIAGLERTAPARLLPLAANLPLPFGFRAPQFDAARRPAPGLESEVVDGVTNASDQIDNLLTNLLPPFGRTR